MDKTRDCLALHPGVVGLIFAGLAAMSAWHAFHGGMDLAELRAEIGDRAREASEALGG